jgi:hypothetical protein
MEASAKAFCVLLQRTGPKAPMQLVAQADQHGTPKWRGLVYRFRFAVAGLVEGFKQLIQA